MRADVVSVPGSPQALIAGPITGHRAVLRATRAVSESTDDESVDWLIPRGFSNQPPPRTKTAAMCTSLCDAVLFKHGDYGCSTIAALGQWKLGKPQAHRGLVWKIVFMLLICQWRYHAGRFLNRLMLCNQRMPQRGRNRKTCLTDINGLSFHHNGLGEGQIAVAAPDEAAL